jgi:hypothetical protein
MSLPGCADQTIHADTSHLYVHTQLPAHYVNLFMPAVGPDKADNPAYDFKVSEDSSSSIYRHSALDKIGALSHY